MISIIKKSWSEAMQAFGFNLDKNKTARQHEIRRDVDWYDHRGRSIYHAQDNPQLPGTIEELDKPYYDSVDITNAVITASFFNNPLGTGNMTLARTNIVTFGKLPNPEKINIMRVGLQVRTQVPADLYLILYGSVFNFDASQKNYLRGPSFMFPAGFGPAGFSAATNAGILSNGLAGEAGVKSLVYPIPIEPDESIQGAINCYGAANDALGAFTTISATTRVYVIISGPMQRAV